MEFPFYCKISRPKPGYLTETLRIMRLTAIFLFAAFVQVSAKGYTQVKLTLYEKDAPLDKVFKDIQKKTGYYFLYHPQMLQNSKKVSLNVTGEDLEQVLTLCFKDQPLTYSIVATSIVVQEKQEPTPNAPDLSPGQIHGKIADDEGNPIPSATLSIKGTNVVVLAGPKGDFVINNVSEDAVLVISCVGYESAVVAVKGKTEIRISLKRKIAQLDDMQVIAYGTVTKRLNTGDVSTVSSEDITKQPVTDPIMALEGRVPGLYISQQSGVPGSSSTVRLMGQNSIANGNNPLYIIDGVPYTSTPISTAYYLGAPGSLSPFNSINPADIESITVLKDADATSIYGSRGANGVVLITTKKGKAGKTQVDLNVYSGEGQVERKMHLLNTTQYLEMRHEAYNNDNITRPPANAYDLNGAWDTTRYTDWQKALIGGTAQFNNAEGSVSGGNVNTQFLVGGGYTRQTTVYPASNSDQKGSLHFNLTHASENKRFHLMLTGSYVDDNSNMPTADITSSILLAPDAPALHDQFGNLNWQNNTFTNPLAPLLKKSQAITDNVVGNLNLSYELIPGLQLKSSLGYNDNAISQLMTYPLTAYSPSSQVNTGNRQTIISNSGIKTWIAEPQLTFSRKVINGDLNILVGTTFQQNVQTELTQLGSGYTSDALLGNLTAAAVQLVVNQTYTQYHYNAFFGRINYNWQDKYLINLTARRDGSSRFGNGRQFGNFESAGAAWIFSKEKLFQNNIPFLSFGKIKASYGTVGNDQIADYQYLSTYTPYPYSYQGSTGLYPTRIPNPYYGWELIKKLEGGIDLGFLRDRILLSGAYYRNRTSNQLVGYSLPAITGFTSIEANLPAIVQNTGAEFTANTVNIRRKYFSWSSSLNITFPSNKLVSYPNLAGSSYANTYTIGKSLFSQRLYHNLGVNSETGIYTIEDINKDGKISTPQDQVPTKPITQKYFGGFNNTFAYKGFQLSIFFQFVKQLGTNFHGYFSGPGVVNVNQPEVVMTRWQKPGDSTGIQRFTSGAAGAATTALSNAGKSDYKFGDASFIRLKNLSLSYSLPADWQKKAHLQNARIYIQGQNLFMITRYDGFDPETGKLSLPPLRMVVAGIQVTL